MLDEKHELELSSIGTPGALPAPPVRDAAPMAGAAPAAMPVPRRSPRPQRSPPARPRRADDADRTRSPGRSRSLADLRDRGAISPEEYEAKKADLLGRL